MGQHVLLIEDEPHIAEAIRFLLARDGWRVSTLADGGGAVAQVRAARPDVVVLDVMLPGRSGFDILAELRADPEWATLPVLVLTARGQDREREAALRAGATGFLSKPFANDELVTAVRRLGTVPGSEGSCPPGRTGQA